jgi:hypothetical protein
MKKHLFFWILLFAVISLVTSCKKDGITPTPGQGQDKKYFSVTLDTVYLQTSLIDSAFIIWNQAGSEDSLKLNIYNNELKVFVEKLPTGPVNYRIVLVTSKRLLFNNLLWEKKVTADIKHNENYMVQGPVKLDDPAWLPRVILNDHSGLVAFSGIYPGDPHFSFYKIENKWSRIIVDRSYWYNKGGVDRTGGAIWMGNNVLDTRGNYSNDTFFNVLADQTNNQLWNHLEIFMLFSTPGNGEQRGLMFTYDFY